MTQAGDFEMAAVRLRQRPVAFVGISALCDGAPRSHIGESPVRTNEKGRPLREIETRIAIAAPAETVWQVLPDFPRYPEWNPFVRSIAGAPVVGSVLEVEVAPPGGAAMSFRPTVLVAEPASELRWRGKLLVPGIFDGEHYFLVRPGPAGAAEFVHGEAFSGLLVPFFGSVLAKTEAGFAAMNEALKTRCERLAGSV